MVFFTMEIEDNVIIEFAYVYCHSFIEYPKQSQKKQDYYIEWSRDDENYEFNSIRASWEFWFEGRIIRTSLEFC